MPWLPPHAFALGVRGEKEAELTRMNLLTLLAEHKVEEFHLEGWPGQRCQCLTKDIFLMC